MFCEAVVAVGDDVSVDRVLCASASVNQTRPHTERDNITRDTTRTRTRHGSTQGGGSRSV